jgi:hypothetical protein
MTHNILGGLGLIDPAAAARIVERTGAVPVSKSTAMIAEIVQTSGSMACAECMEESALPSSPRLPSESGIVALFSPYHPENRL